VASGRASREVYGVHDSRAWRQALAILAGTTLLRLIVGAIVPLFPDETYYWDWSRTLMAGYFDHPPMIAVLIRAGTALFGNTAFGVRFFPVLAGTGAAAAITFTARELAGDDSARLATLVFACMPLAAAGFVLATPDAPMLCAAGWTMYAVVRALRTPPGTSGRTLRMWWLVAGVSIGLAMASKFTSVLLPAALVVAFVSHPRLQNEFGKPGPYLAVAVAALVLLPVLWWNARHDWVSFRFQLGHGLGEPKGGALGAVNRELELVGGQIGLVSPILFYFVARAVKRAFEPTPDGVRAVLGVVAASCVAFFVYSATRRSVEANWPAIAWLPAVVLLATEPLQSWRSERWLTRGLMLGGVLSAIIYTHVLFPILPLPAPRDQVAKAFGWQLLADKVQKHREWLTSRASFGASDLYFAAERYQDASELAFHLQEHPRVFSLNLTGRPNPYDLWGTFPERAARGAALLLVLDDEHDEPRVIRKLTCCFHIDAQESVALVRRDAVSARKRIWLLSAWNGEWPRRDQPFPWTDP
jgi:4-amino-4-deoxy-L-arabinose transferase-like glycosyltransferase